MSTPFFIVDTTANKISYYHLAAFLVLLPFDFFYSQLAIISFAIHTLIHLKKERLKLLLNKMILCIVAVYLISLFTITYSADKAEGLNIAGRQTAIFFMPVLLVLNELDLHKYKLQLLKIFSLTCTIVMLYLYADALHTIFYFHLPISSLFTTAFINHNFSLPIELHATYLSMYAAFGVFTFLFAAGKENKKTNRFFYGVATVILLAGILQLTSRAVVGAMLIITALGFPVFFMVRKKILFLSISTMVAVCVFFIVIKVDAFKLRYVSELKNDLAQTAINNEVLEPRIARWQLALGLIKNSPLIGYGNGSEKEMMKQLYFENRLYISYLEEFNVHSQYLSFLLRAGIVGLALYLFVLYFSFSVSIQKKDFLFFVFLSLVAIVSISENLLDVNKGIFFFSFFLPFFLLGNHPGIFYKGNRNTV